MGALACGPDSADKDGAAASPEPAAAVTKAPDPLDVCLEFCRKSLACSQKPADDEGCQKLCKGSLDTTPAGCEGTFLELNHCLSRSTCPELETADHCFAERERFLECGRPSAQ